MVSTFKLNSYTFSPLRLRDSFLQALHLLAIPGSAIVCDRSEALHDHILNFIPGI